MSIPIELLFYTFFYFQGIFSYTIYKGVHLDKIIFSNCVSVYITKYNVEDDIRSKLLIDLN